MGKMKNLIEKYTTNFKKELRGKLEALPPKARLGIVLTAFALFAVLCLYMTVTAILTAFALFAVLCLYMTVTAIAGFGKGNGAMEIRHIKKLELYNKVYHSNLDPQ